MDMDARSALAGTSQLSVHCSQCNCSITKWVSQVKNVNSEVTSFKDSLLALQLSYDRLDTSLKDGMVLDAARTTNHYAGGKLWSELSLALNDCQNIILELKRILQDIEYISRRVNSILKHLAEALAVGELVFLKAAVKLLEQNISIPVSMISIVLALQQSHVHDTTPANALQALTALKSEHDDFSSNLQGLLRSSSSAKHMVLQNMHIFSDTVNVFMNNVAASLNQPSATNAGLTAADTQHEDDIPSVGQHRWHLGNASTCHITERDESIVVGSHRRRSSSVPTQDKQNITQKNSGDR